MVRRSRGLLRLPAVVALGALSAAAIVAAPRQAQAGIFDFLFGGPQQPPGPPITSYAEPPAQLLPLTPAPRGAENINPSAGDSGRVLAFCVRLCDGENFPLERIPNATPVETCRSMCPASKTQVFFGSAIDHATASDGTRYAALDNAYVYRQHLVANCTCNGKDAFGLAPYDLSNDKTLRPGDIVATTNGFVAYSGRRHGAALFTAVDSAKVAAELDGTTAPVRLSRAEARRNPPVVDDPGTLVSSRNVTPIMAVSNQFGR